MLAIDETRGIVWICETYANVPASDDFIWCIEKVQGRLARAPFTRLHQACFNYEQENDIKLDSQTDLCNSIEMCDEPLESPWRVFYSLPNDFEETIDGVTIRVEHVGFDMDGKATKVVLYVNGQLTAILSTDGVEIIREEDWLLAST